MQYRFNFSTDTWNCNQLIVTINSNKILLLQVKHGMTFTTPCYRTPVLLDHPAKRNISVSNVTFRGWTVMSLMHNKFCNGSITAPSEAEDLTHLLPCWHGETGTGSGSVTHTRCFRVRHSSSGSSEAVGGKTPEKCTLEQSRTLLSLWVVCYFVLEKASWTPGWFWMCTCVVYAQTLPFTCKLILL